MKAVAIILAAFFYCVLGKVLLAGVNIPGCEFGCGSNGDCTSTGDCPPEHYDSQMGHFFNDDRLNIFRLPVGWQYLTQYNPDNAVDQDFFFNHYNVLVQSCLDTGAACVIDVHNYARWAGYGSTGIIGQGGPSNGQFAYLWSQLASYYANVDKIVFGIMNEPHELDIYAWRDTLQEVVKAIRDAGAKNQWILLPGTDYSSAGAFKYNSADALNTVTNPDGSTDNLFFDVHRYYNPQDTDIYTDCGSAKIDEWNVLSQWLYENNRQALVTETGGLNSDNCIQYVCQALDYLNERPNLYLGWIGWGAGALKNDPFNEVPDFYNNNQDQWMVSQCVAGKFQ